MRRLLSLLGALLMLAWLATHCTATPQPTAGPASTPTAQPSPTALPSSTLSPTMEGATPDPVPSPTLDPERPPSIQLRAGATLFDGLEGSYCWQGGRRGLCVDKVFPNFEAYQPWPAGQTMEIVVNGPAPIELNLQVIKEIGQSAVVSVALTSGRTATWTPSVPPGNYAVAVFARWPEGDVVYYFPMTFQ